MALPKDIANIGSIANAMYNSITANTTAFTSMNVGNTTVNAVVNSTAFTVANSTVNYSYISPTAAQKANTSFFLNANGSWITPPDPNGSATTTTSATSITLTNTSTRLQSVAFTQDAQSVILPDARTLNIGGPLFVINNSGARTFGVRSGNPNQFVPADFSAATGWTTGTGWTIGSGVATKTAGVQSDLTQAIATTLNIRYTITFTITSVSAGGVQPVLTGGGADVLGTLRTTAGTYTETFLSNGNNLAGFRGNATFAGSIDNVSITQTFSPLVTVVPPGATAELSQTSVATIAGSWVVSGHDLSPGMVVVDVLLPSTITQTTETVVQITDVLSLHYARDASSFPYAYLVDHSTIPATVGAPVLITSAAANVVHSFRISNTKVVVFLSDNTARNISISGTTPTISASTAVDQLLTNGDSNGPTASFSGPPLIVQMGANFDQFIVMGYESSSRFTNRVQALDCSAAAPTAGTAINIGATHASGGIGAAPIALYRITATAALAIYLDDSGTAGSPFSIRAMVLSLAGTTITAGTSAGLNDVTSVTIAWTSCQLSSTSYIVSYYDTVLTRPRVVSITVSGTTCNFGTPVTLVDVTNIGTGGFVENVANRFQPNLFTISSTSALVSVTGRSAVLTNTSGVITVGTILNSGVNISQFPKTPTGYMVGTISNQLFSFISIDGVDLNLRHIESITGVETNVTTTIAQRLKFGLSNGIRGIFFTATSSFLNRPSMMAIFKTMEGGGGYFAGFANLNAMNFTATTGVMSGVPVEVSPNRAAFTAAGLIYSSAVNTGVKLNIMEFVT
jgi:hypothetical protein